MKKLLIVFILMVFGLSCYADDSLTSSMHSKRYVICSQDNKRCTVGKHSLMSGDKPLYVDGSIVCTNDRKTCTNGITYVYAGEPIEVVDGFALCIKNRSVCTVGEHSLNSTLKHPLFIGDGIICMPNKQLCTNGFQYIQSNEPLK